MSMAAGPGRARSFSAVDFGSEIGRGDTIAVVDVADAMLAYVDAS
jgi:hypothetical protein